MEEVTKQRTHKVTGSDGGGLVWFLGVIGAAVYYVQNAQSFADGAFGILKALVWPAMLVYYSLSAFGL